MIKVEVINTYEKLVLYKDLWDKLVNNTPGLTIFQQFNYIKTWYEIYGNKVELKVLVFKSTDSEEVIGIFPLYIIKKQGIKRLCILGDTHSDYSHLILSKEDDRCAKMVELLMQYRSDWDLIYFNSYLEKSATEKIVELLERSGLMIQKQVITNSLTLSLTGEFNDYLKSLAKNLRSDSKRQIARLEKEGDLRFELIAIDEFEKYFNIFAGLHSKRWGSVNKNTLFNDSKNRDFYFKVANIFAHEGRLSFSRLMLNDEILAMHLGFINGNIFYYFIPVFNTAYANYSVGRIMLLYLIEMCYSLNLGIFDFMAGDEKYKRLYSDSEAKIIKTFIYKNNLRGKLLYEIRRFIRMR